MPQELHDLDSIPASRLLTRPQVAKLIGISVSTLKAWSRQGRGPKIVRPEPDLPRYRADDLRKWIGGRDV